VLNNSDLGGFGCFNNCFRLLFVVGGRTDNRYEGTAQQHIVRATVHCTIVLLVQKYT
jgi:hypothetical protein